MIVDKIKKEITTFLIILFILSGINYLIIAIIDHPDKINSIYAVIAAFSPFISAIITNLIFQRNIRGLGWKWGKTKYQLLSYILPAIYGAIVYIPLLIFGLGIVDQEHIAMFKSGHGLFINILIFATGGIFFKLIASMGEEVGWRGFLIVKLVKITSFTKASLITGIIWAVWHYPVIFIVDYGNKDLFSILCFTLTLISFSFIFTWIRLKSGSVWTGVILHASHNYFILNLYKPLVKVDGFSKYIVGEFGFGLVIVLSIIAFIFWKNQDKLPSYNEIEK